MVLISYLECGKEDLTSDNVNSKELKINHKKYIIIITLSVLFIFAITIIGYNVAKQNYIQNVENQYINSAKSIISKYCLENCNVTLTFVGVDVDDEDMRAYTLTVDIPSFDNLIYNSKYNIIKQFDDIEIINNHFGIDICANTVVTSNKNEYYIFGFDKKELYKNGNKISSLYN